MRIQEVTKRILSMAAIAAMLLAACPTAYSASSQKIDGFVEGVSLEDMFHLGQSGDYRDLEVRAGDEIRIPLTADMFTWSDGRNPLPMEAVGVRELVNSRIRVGTKFQAGNITLDYVQLDTDVFPGKPFFQSGSTTRTGRTAHISVMIAEEYVGIEDKEFSLDVFLNLDGNQSNALTINLTGVLVVDTVQVDKYTDYVDLSEGLVADVTETARDVSVDAGNDITIKKSLLSGQRYYATSQIKEPYDPDIIEDFPEIYPALETVYKLHTVNMRQGKSEVTLDIPIDPPYFVYGEDMTYLGKSNETLPFSEYYFMSRLELPTLEQVNYEEGLAGVPNSERKDSGTESLDNPETGGSADYAANSNINPGTGGKA